MKVDRQSVLDAALLLIGSAIGASASMAFFIHHWVRRPVQGDHAGPPGEASNK